MPVPVIVGAAAAIAARLAARKLAQEAAKKAVTRTVGGITGKGAAKINPVYKETGNSVKVIKAGSKPLTEPNRIKNIGAEIDAATKAANATSYQRFMAGNKKFFGPK
jgi:tripartite-type tricarboxylate transporter receptor subunit TctC